MSQPVVSPVEGRVARCSKCSSFTYDVTGLSDEEVRRLVLETEGRVLTRLVMRLDGRGMSVDCGHDTVRAPTPGRRRLGVVAVSVVVLAAALAGWVSTTRPPAPMPAPVGVELPPAGEPVTEVEAPVNVAEPTTPPDTTQSPVAGEEPSLGMVDEHAVDSSLLAQARVKEARLAALGDVHLADVTGSWSKLELPSAQLVQTVEVQLGPVRRCYGELLRVDHNYRGTLTTYLSVEKGGSVSRVSLPVHTNRKANDQLQACVEGALKELRFGRQKTAGTVSFRLVFAGAR